ncbi:MAG: hypothetical protein WCO23_01230 [bacterium]
MGPCQTQILNQREKIDQQSTTNFSSPARYETPSFDGRIEDYKTGLEITLQSIFPTKQEETKLIKARRVLGDIVTAISDTELESDLAEFQYLIDSWLDEFEKQIFDNKTLIEVLREGVE